MPTLARLFLCWGDVGIAPYGYMLFTSLLVQHVPHAQHVHDTQSPIVQTVAGTDITGTLIPQVTAVVGTDVALEAAVVVSLQDVQNAGIAVAVTMGSFGEVAVFEMLDVADTAAGCDLLPRGL